MKDRKLMEEKLIKLCRILFERDDITMDSYREEIEQWDSLAHVMLIGEVESEFQVKIPFDAIGQIQSLKDIKRFLEV